jgi:hypothetical protein
VDEERPSTDGLRSLVGADHGVLHERGAEAMSLGAQVDAEPGEQDHGDRAPASGLQQRRRRIGLGDRRGCERVVADDAILALGSDDVDDRGSGGLRRPRDLSQPLRLRVGPAVEGGDVMLARLEPDGLRELHGVG